MEQQEPKRYEDHIVGRNAGMEALKSGRPLDSVLVARGERQGSIGAIVARCRENGIPVKETDSRKLDAMAQSHQGVIAIAVCKHYVALVDSSRSRVDDLDLDFLPLFQKFRNFIW